MTLVGADSPSIRAERESLLFAACDNGVQFIGADRDAMRMRTSKQLVHLGPSFLIQYQADATGIVSQHETEELAFGRVR